MPDFRDLLLSVRPIGVVRTPYRDKVSAPRQGYVDPEAEGTIVLEAGRDFEHALSDVAEWDYLWVLYWFHLNPGWRPKVLPPRSKVRRGVFSTRSPHRPNPIGLSVVRLVRVDGLTLTVRGVDMVDGTPVLDLKPYVPAADAIADARGGWLTAPLDPIPPYEVRWAPAAEAQTSWLRERGVDLVARVEQPLRLGPEPHPYRRIRKDARGLVLAVKEWRVRFEVDEKARVVTVLGVETGYRSPSLASPELALHRAFADLPANATVAAPVPLGRNPTMRDSMWALTYDRTTDPWDKSSGMRRTEVERPTLDEAKSFTDSGMVLIKTRYAGFCGSDRGIWFRRAFGDMIYEGLDRDHRNKRVMGHELLGEVVSVGSMASREFGYQPGDIVSTESHIVCGTCYQCRTGDNHVCADNLIIGISTDGCFAEYVKLPARALWRTDTRRIRPEIAALQEPFGNAVHACTKVNLRGKRVAIIGCGTIGLFAVAVAKALGARLVIGVEPMPSHAEKARQLGADHVLTPKNLDAATYTHDPELAKEVRSLTDGVGVDVALEMSGQPSSVNNAIACVRRGGDVILFGLKSGDQIIEGFDRVIVDGISLHSVVGRRIFETWHITRNLLENRDPNIHDKIWDIILENGKGTVTTFGEYDATKFEESFKVYPKVVLKFGE